MKLTAAEKLGVKLWVLNALVAAVGRTLVSVECGYWILANGIFFLLCFITVIFLEAFY